MTEELNEQQQAWLDHYLGDCYLNATEAARKAGYSHPQTAAYRLRRHPVIVAQVAEHLEQITMQAADVLAHLTLQAQSSIADVVDFDVARPAEIAGETTTERKPWWPAIQRAIESGAIKTVKKLSYDKAGNPTLELYSAQAALEILARHHSLLTKRIEHTGADGKPIQIEGGVSFADAIRILRGGDADAGADGGD